MEYKKPFDVEFLNRTQELIKDAGKTKYEVTFLLNCLLGLICLPIEIYKEDINSSFRLENDEVFSALTDKLNCYVTITEGKDYITPYTKLRCLRNGIAHLAMEAFPNDEGKVDKIEIKGSTRGKNHSIKCIFNFSVDSLKDFAAFSAEQLQNFIESKTKKIQ
ncbi:HEPN family nuclease [Christensenella intestinihominis]|uniref:HEPN family nuclease n=1 Tax=Christensenella intestinihominis TaxID=1851429 RepID=UPI00082BA68E|nr:HEPN family nuclease [Christensenella intestinihominis]